jgi:hypothetical protein
MAGIGGVGLVLKAFEKLCEAVTGLLEDLKTTYKAGVHDVLITHRKEIGKLSENQLNEFFDSVIAGSGCPYDLLIKVHLYGRGRMTKVAFEAKWLKAEFFLLLPEKTQDRINNDAVTAVVKKNTVVDKNFSKVTTEEFGLIFDRERPERGELLPNQQTTRSPKSKYLRILNAERHPDDPRRIVLECAAHNTRHVVSTTIEELKRIIKRFEKEESVGCAKD